MNQLYPDQGLVVLLQRMVTADLSYRLFVNNITPGLGTNFATLTEETTGGYTPITVSSAAFTTTGVTGHIGTLLAAPISWTPAGAAWTTYGYFVTDVGGSLLLAVARFDGAPVSTPSGGTLALTPKFSDFSKFAA